MLRFETKMIVVALMKESAVKVVQKHILSHDVFAVQVLFSKYMESRWCNVVQQMQH